MQIEAVLNIAEENLPILHPDDNGPITVPVFNSTLVEAITYHPAKRALDVFMTTGSVYRYSRVPLYVAFLFASAQSKGVFFNENIRGQYDTQRLG